VKAITFDISIPRIAAAKLLGVVSPRAFGVELGARSLSARARPRSLGTIWVLVEPRLAASAAAHHAGLFQFGHR